MSQNINYIRNELQGFIEVDSVFDIKKGDLVKYITLDEDTDEEYFYKGGKYIKMGDNKMYIDSGNVSSVPLGSTNSVLLGANLGSPTFEKSLSNFFC